MGRTSTGGGGSRRVTAWRHRRERDGTQCSDDHDGRPPGGIAMTQTLSDRLTAQELRVALAVAHGSTNKAVARELGVSVKTIEFHLASVYRKAGVASRGELAHLLRSLAVEPPTGTVSFLCVELSAADVDGLLPARRAIGLLGECRARLARFVADAGGYACH